MMISIKGLDNCPDLCIGEVWHRNQDGWKAFRGGVSIYQLHNSDWYSARPKLKSCHDWRKNQSL
jgi:hypothetical protein